ncbi:MAG: glycosyltransferase family 4 protein [Phycisphaerales bacterium]|nr:glycosyltransferase family 4 protein [Phycisphaerales bacterium]
MRILHAIPQFPYFGGRTIIGGYSSALLELAIAQGRDGHEVTIVSHMADPAGRGSITPNVRTVELFADADPGSISHGVRFVRAASAWARAHRNEFDIAHVHSGFADYLLAASRIRTRSGLPTVHTMYCPVPERGGRWNRPMIKWLLHRSARRLDMLSAMSRNVADSMEAWGLPGVQVVPPAVDLERFKPGRDAAVREAIGLTAEHTVILFVGNATSQKNLTRVLDAFAAMQKNCEQARLVITTELPRSSSQPDLQALRRQIDELGIEPLVVQLGIIDNMPAIVRNADMLISPFMDSLGPSDYFVAAMEALASGVPVISSDVGGMPELIAPPRGRLVNPSDVQEMTLAMLEYAENSTLREKAGEDARRFALETFEPTRASATYNRMYEGIITGSS